TTQTRTTDAQNQITSISGTAGTPQYDANGNMISDQNGNTLKYDAWNRLISVTNSSGQIIAQYSYDARGYRVTESYPQGGNGVPAGTVNYIYYDSNWQAVEVRTDGTGASDVTSQTVWSAAYVNSPVLQDSFAAGVIQPDSRIYFLHDANWNTTAVVTYNATTQTWGVAQRYVYSPYGSILILNSDFSTPPSGTQPLVNNLYQGMTLDQVTGLYYARNRNYSPSLGVWISQDPLQYINGANTYQMEMSGPVRSVDPSGLDCCSAKFKAYKLAVAAQAAATAALEAALTALQTSSYPAKIQSDQAALAKARDMQAASTVGVAASIIIGLRDYMEAHGTAEVSVEGARAINDINDTLGKSMEAQQAVSDAQAALDEAMTAADALDKAFQRAEDNAQKANGAVELAYAAWWDCIRLHL
ncbi:MAG: hypothetical protein HKL96_08035, partial [Phycisphaerales bacterium]|nr:hypothetical protein [Phycisphaerales bacterium]